MMLHLLLLVSLALTPDRQQRHDDLERSYQAQIHYAGDRIFWQEHASKEQRKAFDSALKCYVKFHLYKTSSCYVQLDRLKKSVSE